MAATAIFSSKIKEIFFPEEEGADWAAPTIEKEKAHKDNIIEMNPVSAEKPLRRNRDSKTSTVSRLSFAIRTPEVYNDVLGILDPLREGKPVVINLDKLDKQNSLRVMDVLMGGAYMMDAKLKRFSNNTILLTPEGVAIDEQFEDESTSRGFAYFG